MRRNHPEADPTTAIEKSSAAISPQIIDPGVKRKTVDVHEKTKKFSSVKMKMKMKKKGRMRTEIPSTGKLGQALKHWKEVKVSERPPPEKKEEEEPMSSEPKAAASHLIFCITCDRLIPAEKSAAHLPLGHDTVKIFDSRGAMGKSAKRPAEPKPVVVVNSAAAETKPVVVSSAAAETGPDEEGQEDRVANRQEPASSSPDDSPHNSDAGQVCGRFLGYLICVGFSVDLISAFYP